MTNRGRINFQMNQTDNGWEMHRWRNKNFPVLWCAPKPPIYVFNKTLLKLFSWVIASIFSVHKKILITYHQACCVQSLYMWTFTLSRTPYLDFLILRIDTFGVSIYMTETNVIGNKNIWLYKYPIQEQQEKSWGNNRIGFFLVNKRIHHWAQLHN